MKKKQDPLMLLIYGIILVFVLYFAAGLGTAMDISVNEKGAMDFGKLSENLESTIMNTDLVFLMRYLLGFIKGQTPMMASCMP